jgi:branched-chain amino acid transport system substrate-binding protein
MAGFGNRLAALAAGVVLSLSLAGCGEPEPLRIGFLGGVSGRVADLGIGGRNGAQMAIEAVNRAGGIDGRQVILVVKDDAQNPEQAVRAMREFGQTGIRLVIGPMTSAMAVAALPVAEEFGILLVSPTVTTHDLSGKDDNFVRVLSPATDYARKSAEFQLGRNGLRRIVAIHDSTNAAYAASWLSAFRDRFEANGGRIVAEVAFSSGQQLGLRDLVARSVRGPADGLLILANSVDAALIAQYARSERSDLPIVMSEWPATERFIELAGAAAEGVTAAQFFDRQSPAPAYETFRASFRQRFGVEPGFAGVTGYDAATLALRGLAKSVANPKPQLVDIKHFEGLQGPIRIDRFGDAQRKTFITRVENGQFRVVE